MKTSGVSPISSEDQRAGAGGNGGGASFVKDILLGSL